MLQLWGVHAGYGSGVVLQGVSLRVGAGEVVGLLGRNGAGKTTLLKAILGLVERQGRILFQGKDLTSLPPYRIPRLGIAYLPQGERLFPQLTLRENLMLAARDELGEVIEYFPELEDKLEQRTGTLSGGEQQLAALARALLAKPKLLLLDEPSEGLGPQLVRRVEELLRAAGRRGGGILLAEQRVGLLLRLAERICILEGGRIVWAGEAGELRREELERHLGIRS